MAWHPALRLGAADGRGHRLTLGNSQMYTLPARGCGSFDGDLPLCIPAAASLMGDVVHALVFKLMLMSLVELVLPLYMPLSSDHYFSCLRFCLAAARHWLEWLASIIDHAKRNLEWLAGWHLKQLQATLYGTALPATKAVLRIAHPKEYE
jgi:hypothetical protein